MPVIILILGIVALVLAKKVAFRKKVKGDNKIVLTANSRHSDAI